VVGEQNVMQNYFSRILRAAHNGHRTTSVPQGIKYAHSDQRPLSHTPTPLTVPPVTPYHGGSSLLAAGVAVDMLPSLLLLLLLLLLLMLLLLPLALN